MAARRPIFASPDRRRARRRQRLRRLAVLLLALALIGALVLMLANR